MLKFVGNVEELHVFNRCSENVDDGIVTVVIFIIEKRDELHVSI